MSNHAPLHFRAATADDLATIIAMLADDPLGATREQAMAKPDAAYLEAFAAIDADPGEELIVACLGDQTVGVLQLSLIPSLTRHGCLRAQIEGVRVHADQRGSGIGRALFEHAIGRARARGAGLVQLTTDRARPDAHRFYASLGFVDSHIGMKLDLGR